MPLNFSDLNNNSNENNKFNDIHTRYMNGRILPTNKPITPFELFQGERKETVNSYEGTTLENGLETTSVSKLFFSNRNKEYLHKKIIDEVFIRSNNTHTITRQSDLHLLIIMRSIYLQYGLNAFCDIEEQVKKLDEIVVKECVSRVLVELEQRMKYNDFVSKTPEQIPLPKNPSIRGDKILYSKIG
jgi:hypothetical protein